jgi:transcriptional regulator with XRE-family HTH domain
MRLRIGRSRLPRLLANREMSQAELARRLSVSDAFISQVISGSKYLSLETAYRAARILRCTVEDLYELIEE